MKKFVSILMVVVVLFSLYHLGRDILQIAKIDNPTVTVAHRSHKWCTSVCDFVTVPLDIAGIILPLTILKFGLTRARVLFFGVLISASTLAAFLP